MDINYNVNATPQIVRNIFNHLTIKHDEYRDEQEKAVRDLLEAYGYTFTQANKELFFNKEQARFTTPVKGVLNSIRLDSDEYLHIHINGNEEYDIEPYYMTPDQISVFLVELNNLLFKISTLANAEFHDITVCAIHTRKCAIVKFMTENGMRPFLVIREKKVSEQEKMVGRYAIYWNSGCNCLDYKNDNFLPIAKLENDKILKLIKEQPFDTYRELFEH